MEGGDREGQRRRWGKNSHNREQSSPRGILVTRFACLARELVLCCVVDFDQWWVQYDKDHKCSKN